MDIVVLSVPNAAISKASKRINKMKKKRIVKRKEPIFLNGHLRRNIT